MTSIQDLFKVLLCVVGSFAFAQEECKLTNGGQGYCTDIDNCESAKWELRQKIKPLICRFERNTPIICCPVEKSLDSDESSDYYSPSILFPKEEIDSQDIPTKLNPSKYGLISGDQLEGRYRLIFRKPSHFYRHSTNRKDVTFSYNSGGVSPTRLHLMKRPINKLIRFPNDRENSNVHSSTTAETIIPEIDVIEVNGPEIREEIGDNSENQTVAELTTTSVDLSPVSVTQESELENKNKESEVENKNKEISNGKAEKECKKYIEFGLQFLTRTKYITGGSNADFYEFPHMAALGYKTKTGIEWKCGGSLISQQFILTAAHCAKTQHGPVEIIRLGDIDTREDPSDTEAQSFKIAEVFVHPLYTALSKYHDIAILKLEAPVNYTTSVRPACLQPTHDFENATLLATGWGAVFFTGDGSNILQKVDLRLFSTETCRKVGYRRQARLANGIVDEMQICAGNPESGKDTCQGDSGGPLQIQMVNNRYIYKIVGITSFGKNCGVVPGVYTRVSRYIQWIEEIVWPD